MDAQQLAAWLAEDGTEADLTTQAVVDPEARARARVVAKAELVVAGVGAACAALGDEVMVLERAADGQRVKPGETVLVVEGQAHVLLTRERLALNLLLHLSGIATLTDQVVAAVHAIDPTCQVLATRKTTPGLRALEHAAVVAGGGRPHRRDLSAAILIKENHLAFTTIEEAVAAAREASPDAFLMVEAESPEEGLAAARAGADGVLFDELEPDAFADAAELVRHLRPGIVIEASGGLHLGNVAAYAAAADRVSLGCLTHSAPAADLSLELEPL